MDSQFSYRFLEIIILFLFRPRKASNHHYVNIMQHPRSCNSLVGMVSEYTPQTLFLAGYCINDISSIQHEFLHAVGVYHTHSRSDRDEYVTIHWDNIPHWSYNNFCKESFSLNFKTKYEPRSFMHYRWNAVPLDSLKPTISLKVHVTSI